MDPDAAGVRRVVSRAALLIPADGFYEWRRDENGKVPIWLDLPDDELFAFRRHLGELRAEGGRPDRECSIVTTQPNDTVRPIHDRMPVILPRDAEAAWLSADAEPEDLMGLLVPSREELETRRSTIS